ncbi:iron hydrogenase [Sphaerosporella brunnea]|uniref:Nuclear architecture-related protein 1 n=1 Tax=Sphaerosporella brunnea TaxID=1250544 RepID=A0A5J5F0G7_9PEZI|nr:iron hydrogenase [Sphaerosporella brunnea]
MSAILSAEALNDFIAPSVACIKPVESLPPPPPPSNDLTVAREDTLPATQTAQTTAQISLTDCLACSGCITSSEAVLVQLQSHTEVLKSVEQYPNRRFLAVVSPQTRAALAVALGMREKEAGNIVSRLLTTVGFEAVVDEGVFRGVEHWFASREVVEEASTDGPKKPILASSCPGFICYLESTHPELIPHLSALKSPQAIAGTFLKALLIGERKAKSPEDVYVVGVMPCFDKKLEGARGELTSSAWRDESSEETPVRDIDCVITTRELLSLAEIKGINVRSLSREPVPTPQLSADPTIQAFLSVATANPQSTGTSGGNLSAILRSFLQQHPEATLQIQQGRNIDTVDYLLSSSSGDVIAKFTHCYGFRNIQNLVYVEVMACPGGCTNGGGQIKYDDEVLWKELGLEKWRSQRELLAKVDEAYFSSDEGEKKGEEEGEVRKVLDAWIRITGVVEEKLVKTTYRKVANDIGGQLGEKEVLEIASRTGGGW